MIVSFWHEEKLSKHKGIGRNYRRCHRHFRMIIYDFECKQMTQCRTI